MTDIIVTWPKKQPLGSYLTELELAKRDRKVINFRVPSAPHLGTGLHRCFRVHDGRIRGWVAILGVEKRGRNEVARVQHGRTVGHWPPGWYIVCDPTWHEIPSAQQSRMDGFRGFRYYSNPTVG